MCVAVRTFGTSSSRYVWVSANRESGLKCIFVVIDTFIKVVKLYTMKSTDAKTVERKIINNYIKKVAQLCQPES